MTNQHITIDGASGEGGGQIVRTSTSLAAITGRPVTVTNIRAGRRRPGLKKQHLTAIRAVREICAGRLTGDELQAHEFRFDPGEIAPGHYRFNTEGAGSAMLVLQTVLPLLLTASASSRLDLEGGTHNPWSPPFDFLERCFLPFINQMGPRVTAKLERHGFYPAGGGRVTVEIDPAPVLNGFDILERGRQRSRSFTAVIAELPDHIAAREVKQGIRKLNWRAAEGATQRVSSTGPGNVVFVQVEYDHVTEIFTAFGKQGVKAERVADEVVRDFQKWLKSDAPVGEHLADQILLPLALSAAQQRQTDLQRGGTFRAQTFSQHTLTHAEILKTFLPIEITMESASGLISVAPIE